MDIILGLSLFNFEETFLGSIVTCPITSNPTPIHFSFSLCSTKYIVSAFPSVISIFLMKDILFYYFSFILLICLNDSFFFLNHKNRSIYFLFSIKLLNFWGGVNPLKWKLGPILDQKKQIIRMWESQRLNLYFIIFRRKWKT